jgi:hypothetical protein
MTDDAERKPREWDVWMVMYRDRSKQTFTPQTLDLEGAEILMDGLKEAHTDGDFELVRGRLTEAMT